MIGQNVIDGKYYFTVDNDALFSVDEDLNVLDTGFRDVIKVVDKGVYTGLYSDIGLKYIPFDNGSSITFDEFSSYSVTVLYEKDNNVYLSCRISEGESRRVYCVDTATQKVKLLSPDDAAFSNSMFASLNFYGSSLVFSTAEQYGDTWVYSVYISNKEKTDYKEIYSQVGGSLPFCAINIVNEKIFISFPVSSLDLVIIDANDIL